MQRKQDRRKSAPVADSERGGVLPERRKRGERRIEKLAMEDRQTLLAEMPGPIPGPPAETDD